MHGHKGSFRIEGAAAGEANDIVQKAQRARHRAVLVVDLGIHVAVIGGSNKSCSRLEILLGPFADLDLARRGDGYRALLIAA